MPGAAKPNNILPNHGVIQIRSLNREKAGPDPAGGTNKKPPAGAGWCSPLQSQRKGLKTGTALPESFHACGSLR